MLLFAPTDGDDFAYSFYSDKDFVAGGSPIIGEMFPVNVVLLPMKNPPYYILFYTGEPSVEAIAFTAAGGASDAKLSLPGTAYVKFTDKRELQDMTNYRLIEK